MKRRIFALAITFGLITPSFAAFKVGVTAGPHAIIMEKIKDIAQKKNFDIQVIEFNDFILPNSALDNKELDVNSYQHKPFLIAQNDSRGYKIVAIAETVLMPLGIYSKKLQKISDCKEGAKVTIPNDPTNGGRALKLLEKAGFIKLKAVENPTILDIIENSKNLKIQEIEAPQLPRTLDDTDLSIINTDWVLLAGLDPKTALLTEGTDSPYVNVLAVRQGDESRDDIKTFIELYRSPEIKKFIEETFKGAVLPAW
jgi:D-methionine transport system substrate-binding protein